jgi:catechol 2,3-dioxygenase-like lactoylglutathione lyase family enzyme
MLGRARGAPPRDPATSVAPSATPATAPSKRPSRRGSLSAAVHGRRLAHHEILANHKPESPERGDGRLDRSSSADDGWQPPGPVEARLAALEHAVEDLDHALAARRYAALRMAVQAGARPSDDLMRQPATLAIWHVDDIDQFVDELTAAGVEIARYDEYEHDAKGITARAGGGRIAWFRDPDGNTFAVEADV